MSVSDSDESSFSRASSFSDQQFKAFGGTALGSSRGSKDTGNPKEEYLSTVFSSSLFQKDIYDAGKVDIYPKCMQRMLSSDYPKILSVLKETYGRGAFIYVGSSFECLFARHPQQFQKMKRKLICDMCIFPKNKPAILFTVAKDQTLKDSLISYNLQMKRSLEEWMTETLVEFKALSGVVTPDDFQFRRNFQKIIAHAETQSPKNVLPPTLATMILTVETFLQKLATCKFAQRFYGVSEETVYLVGDLLEEFIELLEEENNITVYPICSDYTMPLACELGYRLALIGHTSIHSKSEEKREFEELRKAENLSISITYDRSVADENLEEGDVLMSSWKGGTIRFRTASLCHSKTMTVTAAARRTLASAVVNRSAKVLDEERRNRLLDLICLNIKRAEEHLENTLRRADSESQIAELESFNIYPRNEEAETYPTGKPTVEADAPHMFPLAEIPPDFKDSTVQQDLDSEYTPLNINSTESVDNMTLDARYEEYPAGDMDDTAPSHNTNRDEATNILSAHLRRETLSVREDTMHNVHTAQRRRRRRVSDETHLHKWLSMHDLPITSGNIDYISHTSTEDPPTPIGIRRSSSDVTPKKKTLPVKAKQKPCRLSMHDSPRSTHAKKRTTYPSASRAHNTACLR